MIVILNPSAGGGTAFEKWRRIEPQLRRQLGPFELVIGQDATDVRRVIAERLAAGETDFVAAGGDGTVNRVASSLFEEISRVDLHRIRLGAIGLGSSNDFHKPLRADQQICGIPCCIDFEAARPRDVCLVSYTDEAGVRWCRPWLINASIGVTAEANGFFNRPNRTLKFLKRRVPGLAIIYAALRTLLKRPAQNLVLRIDDRTWMRARVANLGVVKSPHFTGSLKYDSQYEPANGRFHVHMLADVSRPRLLLALVRLARGRFSGQRGARSWPATQLGVAADRAFALEGDGEVVFTSDASFHVVPRLLRVAA
jgi:diacylglycerol kinase family enzyme